MHCSHRVSSVRFNKFCWIDPPARIFAITWADKRREKFAHFKMEMREVTAVGSGDSRDLLAAFHGFAGMHQHVLNVAVIRLHVFTFAVFEMSVQQNDNVAPTGTAVARHETPPARDGRL